MNLYILFALFAQLDKVPANSLKDFLLIVAGLLGIVVAFKGVFWPQKREITPQPLEVRGSPSFVAREEFDRHAAQNREDHQIIFEKIEEGDALAARNLNDAMREINRDLRKMSNGISALCQARGIKPDSFEV